MSKHHLKAATTVGVLAFAALAGAAGTATAAPRTAPAHYVASDCAFQDDQVYFSLDNGTTWTQGAQGPKHLGAKPTGKVLVKVDEKLLADGGTCKVQLDLYNTQGPDWPTSGTQTFVDRLKDEITKAHPVVTFDASKLRSDACFVQYDLLANWNLYDGKPHDGKTYPLPHYNDVYMDNLIGGWNGRNKEVCTSTSPSAKPSTTPSTTPSATPSTSKPPTSSAPSSAAPVPTQSGEQLAHTGGSGVDPAVLGGAAAALAAAGGAAMYMTRRRRGRFQQ